MLPIMIMKQFNQSNKVHIDRRDSTIYIYSDLANQDLEK